MYFARSVWNWFKGRSFRLLLIFVLAVLAAIHAFPKEWNGLADSAGAPQVKVGETAFRLGLDLQGGTHLIYDADLSKAEGITKAEAMASVRDVIERRVNAFGVSEPMVEVNQSGDKWRLSVDLAGISDVNEAIKQIGETPYLDFREERPAEETQKILEDREKGDLEALSKDPYFIATQLNGSYLKRSQVTFDPTTYEPVVSLEFNGEGAKLFEDLTKKNLGKRVAIYLDGEPISAPVVQAVISGGQAVITGSFSVEEAQILVQRLNAGALPVPITLVSQSTIGASLGKSSLDSSLSAAFWALIIVGLFMILYYRLPGFLAVIALLFYAAFNLAIFKLFGVTLTLAGIAGFILSLGMAVDANILIFERMKEELKAGNPLDASVTYGIKRAWTSIRDSNFNTIIASAILYVFTTSFVKGFALTLIIGVLLSMFTAIVVTNLMLSLVAMTPLRKINWLFKPMF